MKNKLFCIKRYNSGMLFSLLFEIVLSIFIKCFNIIQFNYNTEKFILNSPFKKISFIYSKQINLLDYASAMYPKGTLPGSSFN